MCFPIFVDRLFGYVVPDADDGAKGGDVACRGRLSFGFVNTSEAHICREKQKLSPLLSSKPSSARRFLTDSSGATPTKKKKKSKKEEKEKRVPLSRNEYFNFAPEQLLSAAAYPMHRELVQGEGLNRSGFPERSRSEERRVGKECRSRWSPYH